MKKSIGLCVLAFAMTFMFSGMGNAAGKPKIPPPLSIKYAKPPEKFMKICSKWEDIWVDSQTDEMPRAIYDFNGVIYVGTLGDHIFRLDDGGDWESLDLPENVSGISAFESDGDDLFAGGEYGVFRLEGNKWIALKGETENWNLPVQVTSLAVLNGILYAGGGNKGLHSYDLEKDGPWEQEVQWLVTALYPYGNKLYIGRYDGVYVFESGNTKPLGKDGQKKIEYVNGIINFKQSFYAGAHTGIFKLVGGVWKHVLPGGSDVNFVQNGDSLIASVYKKGIFHSKDGNGWQPIEQNAADNSVTDMLIKDNLLHAVTSYGVWTIPLQCLSQ